MVSPVVGTLPGLGIILKSDSGPWVHLGRRPGLCWFSNPYSRLRVNSEGVFFVVVLSLYQSSVVNTRSRMIYSEEIWPFVSVPSSHKGLIVTSRHEWDSEDLVLCFCSVTQSRSHYKIKTTSEIQEVSYPSLFVVYKCKIIILHFKIVTVSCRRFWFSPPTEEFTGS